MSLDGKYLEELQRRELAAVAALREIAQYDDADDILEHSEAYYGIDGQEALAMAYENVLSVARAALKGMEGKGQS